METVPPDNPPTVPDTEPTVATAVLLLVHIPPPVVSLSVLVAVVHRLGAPKMADGVARTVMGMVVLHPAPNV